MSTVSKDPLDITVHEEKSKAKVKCFLCPALFDAALDLSDLTKHMNTEHKNHNQVKNTSSTQKMCPLCPALFNERSDFNKHFSSKHAVKKSVQDDFINEKRKKLKSEKTIQCHLCHAKFTRRGNRKQHISNVHEGIKPHQCSDCPAKFAFKACLRRHLI